MSGDIKLEVCVDSIASALTAKEGGASRIELCSALSEGGLTPSVGTLKILKSMPLNNIPIYCMLRPRGGSDFIYSKLELDAILADLELLRANGADGFVYGALTKERTLDMESCQRVIQCAGELPVTFHRAFDLTDPAHMMQTVEQVRDLGFKRLLSSGFRQTAQQGAEHLAQLIARHHRGIIIMPGAGITADNLEELLTVTKCTEFHASARAPVVDSMAVTENDGSGGGTRMDCDVNVGRTAEAELPYAQTDLKVVRRLVGIARAMANK